MILRKKYFIKSLDQSGVDNIQYFIKQINLNIFIYNLLSRFELLNKSNWVFLDFLNLERILQFFVRNHVIKI